MALRNLACGHLKHARTEFSRSWAASVERACLELCADDTAAKLGLKLRLVPRSRLTIPTEPNDLPII